jgi:hypothetical protein
MHTHEQTRSTYHHALRAMHAKLSNRSAAVRGSNLHAYRGIMPHNWENSMH